MTRTLVRTPRADGYWMPGEFERHAGTWMLWPERLDNWRDGARPAQRAFAAVAAAIAGFEPVSVGVSAAHYEFARADLDSRIRLVELSHDDAWMRDVGPTVVVNAMRERARLSSGCSTTRFVEAEAGVTVVSDASPQPARASTGRAKRARREGRMMLGE